MGGLGRPYLIRVPSMKGNYLISYTNITQSAPWVELTSL